MIRPTRLVVAVFVTWWLWWTLQSRLVVVLPGFQEYYSISPEPEPEPDPEPEPVSLSRVAKATVAINSLNSPLIHDALRTHQVQNELHGYRHHINTVELLDDLSENDNQKRPRGAWSKPAYLMSLIVAELTKPVP